MGKYKPGANYVHESPDGGNTIYAREVGTTERRLVGYSSDLIDQMLKSEKESRWMAILHESEKNAALKEAVDRAMIIYELVKNEDPPQWHPV